MAQIAYDDKKYRKGIDTSYYDKAVEAYKKQQETNRQNQIKDAADVRDSALRQAYVQRMQNQLAMNNNLAQAGIRGGASETSNLKLINNYGAQRNAANSDYTNSVTSINRGIDQNIADYQSDMASRAEEYRQNLAQAKWQAEREDTENAQKRATDEINRLTDYWSNYYNNKYSGYSKKQLKKAEKDIKAKLNKAKTSAEKIRWQQALSGIGARRGVIANK